MSQKTYSNRLAVDGGDPVRTASWPPRSPFGEVEKEAAMELFDRCIESGSPIGYNGEHEEGYCREFAEFHGDGFADGVNSGTSALYTALMALELEPFTEVITSPITDPGGVMPVPLLNLIPVPADTEPGSFNVGAEQIAQRLTARTSAIIVTHIAGTPADMGPIMQVARKAGVRLIEDCAQAHGARYRGRLAGTFGDIAVYSTMSGKHHATGPQGGVVYTREEELFRRCRRASDRGKPFDLPAGRTNVVAALNLNSNDLSAAIGRVQLKKLPQIIDQRRRAALALAEGCRSLDSVDVLVGPPESESAFWFIFIKFESEKLRVDLNAFTKALAAEGIPASGRYDYIWPKQDWYLKKAVFGRSGYPWRCPLYQGDPDQVYDLPNCEEAVCNHFRIAFHEKCGAQEVTDTLNALEKVVRAYRV